MTEAGSLHGEPKKSGASDVLVISSCTALKARTLDGCMLRAEQLYVGQQHVRLMRGVRAYRAAGEPTGDLKLRIVSAYHGVVDPDDLMAPYDFSFSKMSSLEITAHAESVGVPQSISDLLETPYGVGLLLLSESYIHACALSAALNLGGPTIVFCSPTVARGLPCLPGLNPVALANREARRFSCGLTSLKGELGGRILSAFANGQLHAGDFVDPDVDVLDLVEHLSVPPQLEFAA